MLENVLQHYSGDRLRNASCRFCEERSQVMRHDLEFLPQIWVFWKFHPNLHTRRSPT